MAQLPLDQAITRFQKNDERLDKFANGSVTESYISSGGASVPSIQKFLAAKDVAINVGAESILAQTTTQAGLAQTSATASQNSAIAAAASATNAADAVNVFKSEVAASNGSGLVGFTQSGTGAVVRTSQDKMRESVSVKDFGAVGNGVTDDRAAFAAAILAARGKKIYVPSGQYLINTDGGSITLEEVCIEGESVLDGATSPIDQGSVLRIVGTTNSLFKVKRGTQIKGLGFFYPNQIDSASPTAYPATFDFDFTGGPVQFVYITDCVVFNAYDFIRINDATGGVGHCWFENNTIYAIRYGIQIKRNLEVIKIRGNTFTFGHWLAATETGCRKWTRENGTAIKYDYGDGIFFSDNLIFGYKIGLQVALEGPVILCRITSNSFDQVRYGVLATGVGNFSTSQIIGNDFNPFNNTDLSQPGNGVRMETTGSGGELLVISSNTFSGASEDAVYVIGDIPTRFINTSGNQFTGWANGKTTGNYAALNINGANTSLICSDSVFAGSGNARTTGIKGTLNTVTLGGALFFNSCFNAFDVVTNSLTDSGCTSFTTVDSVSDKASASTRISNANNYDKPSGNTTEPTFLVRKNASQTFNSGTATDVAWGLESYDNGSNFSSPSFTAPKAGRYRFTFSLLHDNTGTAGDRWQLILLTGGANFAWAYKMISDFNSVGYSTEVLLAAGDVVKLQIQRISGVGNFVTFNDASSNYFAGSLIE